MLRIMNYLTSGRPYPARSGMCGTYYPSYPFTSRTNRVQLRFTTDHAVTGRGFSLRYKSGTNELYRDTDTISLHNFSSQLKTYMFARHL